jgi:hypothetical protein
VRKYIERKRKSKREKKKEKKEKKKKTILPHLNRRR